MLEDKNKPKSNKMTNVKKIYASLYKLSVALLFLKSKRLSLY